MSKGAPQKTFLCALSPKSFKESNLLCTSTSHLNPGLLNELSGVFLFKHNPPLWGSEIKDENELSWTLGGWGAAVFRKEVPFIKLTNLLSFSHQAPEEIHRHLNLYCAKGRSQDRDKLGEDADASVNRCLIDGTLTTNQTLLAFDAQGCGSWHRRGSRCERRCKFREYCAAAPPNAHTFRRWSHTSFFHKINISIWFSHPWLEIPLGLNLVSILENEIYCCLVLLGRHLPPLYWKKKAQWNLRDFPQVPHRSIAL